MAMLIALVAKAGEEVSREELQQKIWAADTFVDFDAAIGTCIRKIRFALSDSAENPTFVRTIHRRGFVFIAPVHYVMSRSESPSADLSAVRAPTLETTRLPPVPPPIETSTPHPAQRRRLVWRVIAAVAVVAGIALGMNLSALIDLLRGPGEPPAIVPFTSFQFDEYMPAFSPDGSEVVFSWPGEENQNVDLYLKRTVGDSVRRLTTDPGRDECAAWSADGHWIAFIRALNDVMLISPEGGQERKIAETNVYFLAWAHDSGSVIIGLRRPAPEGAMDLFAVNVNTGERKRLTSDDEQLQSGQPFGYSPDGKRLAYASRPDSGGESELYVRPAQGGKARRLTFFNRPMAGWTWSPDSRSIVFASRKLGPSQLWRVNVEGGGEPQLLQGAGEDLEQPASAWAPASANYRASELLVYERVQNVMNLHELGVGQSVPPAGDVKTVFASTRRDVCPRIAPDGKRLAFTSDRTGYQEIWLADLSGGKPSEITSLGPSGRSAESPYWSPDGQYLVFTMRDTIAWPVPWPWVAHSDIYTIAAGSGQIRRVTNWTSNQARPSWSRDGKWLYFCSNRTGSWQIWKLAADSFSGPGDVEGHAVQVTRDGGFEAIESADGRWLYYVKTREQTGLWRIPAGDVEADRGGEAVLSGRLHSGWWEPTTKGIFFVDASRATMVHNPAEIPKPIDRLDEKTGAITELGSITRRIFAGPATFFTAAPDGSRVIYSEIDLENRDLMLMRNVQ